MFQKIYKQLRVWFYTYPFFLFLLPAFFLYSGYNELFGFLSAPFVLKNALWIFIPTIITYFLFRLLFQHNKKSALFTFFLLLVSLVFGYLHDVLKQLTGNSSLIRFSILLPFLLFIFIAIFFILRRQNKTYNEAFNFLNLLFLVLLLSEIPNSIKRYRLDNSVHNLIDFRFDVASQYKRNQKTNDTLKPDIYFLLFDAFASSKTIQQTIGRNTNELDSFLSKQGFYLATDAAANYNWTIHSVSTTFNMDYLPSWITPVKDDPKVYFWGSSSFKDNSLFRILKSEGYHIKSYQPISFDNDDWPGNSYFANLKNDHYYFKTLPGRIYRDVFWNYTRIDVDFIRNQQLQIIQKKNTEKKQLLDTTVAIIKKSCNAVVTPKFIYGHFMIPHDPYVFDSTGLLKPAEKTIVRNAEDESAAYYQQVQYATKIIQELVTYIQTHNKKNTIIIVAGDHGFKTEDARQKGYTFNNYSAFYFPDKNYDLLYKSASPVNTFRFVLNKYFDARLPLLKDSSILVDAVKTETIKKSEKIPPTHTPSSPNQ